MFKSIITATIISVAFTSAAKADLFSNLVTGLVGAVIVGGIVDELTKNNINPVNNTHEDNVELWNEVTKIVPILSEGNVNNCANNSGLYGLYYSAENKMVICDGHSYNDFYETLRHETMHLIQDCNAGFNNSALKTSYTHSSLNAVKTARTAQWLTAPVYANASYEMKMLESEAFHYEVFPSKVITKLLKERCY